MARYIVQNGGQFRREDGSLATDGDEIDMGEDIAARWPGQLAPVVPEAPVHQEVATGD
ncbi:MAG TPA: hypothetical protein VL968_05685 [Rhodocyclaceae bacterium]|jgi:hypothetical protein|nr:hypothetical protein [Rhodocyclaceae bacterium]